jgi:hypothetical protein
MEMVKHSTPDRSLKSDAEVSVTQRGGYCAYLVRLWPTRRRGAADYRVSLESVATGDRRDFSSLESLLDYWRALRAGQEPDAPPPDPGSTGSAGDVPDAKR